MLTEERAIIEPTERSMLPVMMMKATIIASMAFSENTMVMSQRL